MKKAAAVFTIAMGMMMLGTWLYLFIFPGYPQAATAPIETAYLLTAEFLTCAALIVSGYGVLTQRWWGPPMILLALGELVYCAIRFAGELGQQGSIPGLTFFTVVGVFGIAFAVYLVASISRKPLPL